MLEFFPLRIYSHETLWRKPNVRIFNEAARRLDLQASEIMFIGDRLDTDIRGAQKAGMTPVLKSAYTNSGKRIPQHVIKIDLLSELPQLLEQKFLYPALKQN